MKQKKTISASAKQTARVKVSKKISSMEEAPFFKKKMEKGAKTLAIAGLPK